MGFFTLQRTWTMSMVENSVAGSAQVHIGLFGTAFCK
jgi:hypothetical protein